tara:strand:- start:335 stop:469 length:135 start_codon:yes stop_codon:yes gene_type:complete
MSKESRRDKSQHTYKKLQENDLSKLKVETAETHSPGTQTQKGFY